MALCGMCVAIGYENGASGLTLILIAIIVGLLGGLFNAILVTKLRIMPFIATLGTQLVFRAMAFISTDGDYITIKDPIIKFIGFNSIGGFPVLLLIMIGVYIIIAFTLKYTQYGRNVYAVGSSAPAAFLSGVNIQKERIISYVICGACSGLASILYIAQSSVALNNAGTGNELDIIASVILGGLSQGVQDRIFGYELFNYTSWLSVDPQSGLVSKDSSVFITINIDGSNLSAKSLSNNSEWTSKLINQIESIYTAYLIINNNDPTNSKINIPISVNVDSFKNFIVSLDSSWNLISWNVISENDSTKNILKNINDNLEIALGYENDELVFDPENQPENNTLNFMDHLHGYWIKMKQSDELSIFGINANPYSLINLEEGWNLVSYLPIQPDSISNALKSISNNLIVVLGYNKGGLMYDPKILDEFNTLKIMQPGFGYWIKTKSIDSLIYPNTNILNSFSDTNLKNNLNVFPTNEWIGIWGDEVKINNNLISDGTVVRAIDNNGVICGEFIVSNEGKFGLMPVYRDDIRTEFDEGAEVGEDVSLYFNDYKFPKGIKWTEMGAVVDFKDLIVSINDDISILPKEFELYQNYPNPFNPATTIKFALPIKSRINLSIYNILGEKIAELINEELEAGYYEKQWNASNFASGIYFYRITSSSFVDTKKLILLK